MKRRINIGSDTSWETSLGYSRAVRMGNIIEVSGTTAVEGHKIIGRNDAAEQTRFILLKIKKAIENAGGKINNVIRTRIFVTDISKWEIIGKVHRDFFGKIKPATTMVEVKSLIMPGLLVEIEVTAIVN